MEVLAQVDAGEGIAPNPTSAATPAVSGGINPVSGVGRGQRSTVGGQQGGVNVALASRRRAAETLQKLKNKFVLISSLVINFN